MALEFLGIDFTTRRELHRDPSWTAARDAIDLLEGESVRTVRLSTAAGTSLSIGGFSGGYVVSGVRCNGEPMSLQDPLAPGAVIASRSEPSAVPASRAVSKALALRAAEAFWKNGTFDSGLEWQAGAVRREPALR